MVRRVEELALKNVQVRYFILAERQMNVCILRIKTDFFAALLL